MASITSILSDTSTHDWTKRIAALHQLTSIALGCSPALAPFLGLFRALRSPLTAQIQDLRSSVLRETCAALSTIAQLAGPAFAEEADVLLPQLLRLVSVSVQVIAHSGDDCIRVLMAWCKPRAGVGKVMEGCVATNAVTRLRCMEYVLCWMQRWREEDADYLGRWAGELERLIGEKMADKTEGVRATARRAAVLFADVWQERGAHLIHSMDEKTRRLFEEERRAQRTGAASQQAAAAEPRRRQSMSKKSAKITNKETLVVEDKENNHPNVAPAVPSPSSSVKPAAVKSILPSHPADATGAVRVVPQAPTTTAAPLRSNRRASMSLQSVTAVDGEVSSGAGSTRLGGAQRVMPPAAAAATGTSRASGFPPRARRLSIVPFPTTIIPPTQASSPAASTSSSTAPSPTPSPHDSSPSSPPLHGAAVTAGVSSQHAAKTPYEALLSSAVSTDLHTAIDAAFADLNRRPRSVSRRQSHTIANPVPVPDPASASAELRGGSPVVSERAAESNKRKSLGPLPSTAAASKPQHRRASMSLVMPAEAVPVQRPNTVSSLLLLARDPVWSTRVSAFDSLTSLLSSTGPRHEEVLALFDRVMYAVIERTTDPHHKVASASLSTLLALLSSLSAHPISPSPVQPHLSALFPPLLLTLSHARLQVRQLANDGLNALAGVVAHGELIGPLAMALLAKEGRVRRGAEEFLGYVIGVGDDEERRRKRDIVDSLMGEAGRKARAVVQAMTPQDAVTISDSPSDEEIEQPTADQSASSSDDGDFPHSAVREAMREAKEDEVEEPAVEETAVAVEAGREPDVAVTVAPLPLSVLLSPHHPINQPPAMSVLLAPPVLSSPPSTAAATVRTPPLSALPPTPLSPIAAEALTRYVQHGPRSAQHSLLSPPSLPLLSPSSAPLPSNPSHSRALSVSGAQSASRSSQRPQSCAALRSSSRPHSAAKERRSTTKRLMVTTPPATSPTQTRPVVGGVGHVGSSKVMKCDAYDGRLSDADVGSLIYQWKHADVAVVQQSLQWMHSLLLQQCALSRSSLDRIILALIDVAEHSAALTDDVLAVLGVLVSSTFHSHAHLCSAAFPHPAVLLELLLSLHHKAVSGSDEARKAKVEALWSSCLALHSPTVLSGLVALLTSAAPTHRDSLTLLLTSLHTVVPSCTAAALNAALPALSAQLTVLLGHEHVLIRKHAVRVWVCAWEVLGDGVERWMDGMGGVSRKLVDIYLKKARDERSAATH